MASTFSLDYRSQHLFVFRFSPKHCSPVDHVRSIHPLIKAFPAMTCKCKFILSLLSNQFFLVILLVLCLLIQLILCQRLDADRITRTELTRQHHNLRRRAAVKFGQFSLSIHFRYLTLSQSLDYDHDLSSGFPMLSSRKQLRLSIAKFSKASRAIIFRLFFYALGETGTSAPAS